MNLNRNAFIICFVSILSCFIFSKTVLAFVTQGDDHLNIGFTNQTRMGSMLYLAGVSSAIMAFSAIDGNNLNNAINNLRNASNSWKNSKPFYENAENIGVKNEVFTAVDQWINDRVNVVFHQYNLSSMYGIGKEIKDKINEMGSKGLIEMTKISIDIFTKKIDGILSTYDSGEKPTYEELFTALIFISNELRKGVIASELFLKPR